MRSSVGRSGKTRGQTPVVPKTSERDQTNNRVRLRKKFDTEVKGNPNEEATDKSKITPCASGLTNKDLERQLFRREKRLMCEAKHRSYGWSIRSGDTNTKKPYKKERQQQTNTCTMSLASFTLLVIVAAAIAVQYLRMQHASISAVGRTTISGSHNLTLFTQDGKYIEDVSIIERDPHALGHSLVLEMCLFGKGPCSNSPANPSPLERSCTPFYHYHLNQNKTITVIEGVMGYFLNDKTQKRVAKRGQTVTFPAMSAHTFWSESTNDDLLIRVRMNPPLKTAPYFENIIGLKKDAPNDWLNLLYTSLESEVYLGELSIMMNRALAVVVEILAKLTGKKAYYKEYTTGAVPSGYEY